MEFVKFLLEISWKQMVIAIVAGLISGSGNALLISLINREVHEGHFKDALLFFTILAFSILITSIVSQFMLIHLSQNAIYELRLKLSQNILSSPLEHLERLKENRLTVTLTEDIHNLTHAVSTIPSLCIDLATVIGCFIFFAVISSALFFLTIASTVAAIWFVQTMLNKAQLLFFKAREEDDALFKHFRALMTGTKELKLNRARREEFMENNLRQSAIKLRQINTKAMKSFAIANGFGQFSQFVSLGFILFILPLFLNIPLAMLATYVLVGTFIALPMQNLLNRIPELVRGNISLRKIERMKLSLKSLSASENLTLAVSKTCHLQLQEVTYRYQPELPPFPPEGHPDGHPPFPPEGYPDGHPDGHPPFPPEGHPPHKNNNGLPMFPPRIDEKGFLLGPITLSLQPGELLFIIGGNGSGKSTLAKLIAGLYTPQAGAIYLNNQRITEENLEWYRQHFSAIFSDFYLFESCLGFNKTDIDEEVEGYLKHLELSHKVQVKNGVFSTLNLSQGQQKRLALLITYLEDRPIYLFDEWASDQEPRFRSLFYTEMLPQLKKRGKIVIVITHDDRYFDIADHIIKLDYGTIEKDILGQVSAKSIKYT